MSHDIIELNGKRYDAITGRLLGNSDTPAVPLAPRPHGGGRHLDGVSRRPGLEHAQTPSRHEAPTVPHAPEPHHRPTVHRKPARTVKPHAPEHAKTLMRRAVHKPDVTLKPHIKVQTPSEIAIKSQLIPAKHSAHHLDLTRAERAGKTAKHQGVKKFNPNADSGIPMTYFTQTAKPQATPHQTVTYNAAPSAKLKPDDIFEAALARAVSHEQPPHKPRRSRKSRIVNVLAGVAAFLILGGFLTYINLPRLEFKLASMQAGFGAQMPGFAPSGYALGDVRNNHGAVVLTYQSGENRYQISQQDSNWNSQTLGDQLVASAGHKTVESKGRIIYLYDGQASWVNSGIRYDITANTDLSQEELVAIATSL